VLFEDDVMRETDIQTGRQTDRQRSDGCFTDFRYIDATIIVTEYESLAASLTLLLLQGGPTKVRPTLLVTFECIGKIQ